MSSPWFARLLTAGSVGLGLYLTRWPLLSPFLTSFDAANFAFALDDFNPAEHKPQPPGYPLYVGLSRLIRACVDDPTAVFAIGGLIAAFIAVLVVKELASEMFGQAAGWPAAIILLVHPVLWAAGLVNPVRVFLAAGSACVAWFAWRAWHPGSARRWLWSAAVALGVASGFRPSLLLLCVPLLVVTAWRRRSSALDCLIAAIALIGGVGSWVWVAAENSGGFAAYLGLLRNYSDEQFGPSSLLFGAPLWPAVKMAGRCVAWTAIPAALWLWMVPDIGRERLIDVVKSRGLFFVVWLLPPLALYTLIHSAEPGHILPLVTPVCVAGGYVVSTWGGKHRWRGVLPGSVTVIALGSALMFFHPPLRVQTLCSTIGVQAAHERVASTMARMKEVMSAGPVVVLSTPSSPVAWRILSYYYPDAWIAVLRTDPHAAVPPSHYMIRGASLVSAGGGELAIPDCGTLVWLRSQQSSEHLGGGIAERDEANLALADLHPGLTLTLGSYKMATTPGNCVSTLSSR